MTGLNFKGITLDPSDEGDSGNLSLRDLVFFLSPKDVAFTLSGIMKNFFGEGETHDIAEAAEAALARYYALPSMLREYIYQSLEILSSSKEYRRFSPLFLMLKEDRKRLAMKTVPEISSRDLFKAMLKPVKYEAFRQENSAPIEEEKVLEALSALISTMKDKGYVERESQIEMARLANDAFNSTGSVVIEAPTGTGKTLGYLIPALLRSYFKKEPVFISTYTKSLQVQVYKKELNLLKQILPPFRPAVLFGRENYPCLLKMEMVESSGGSTLFSKREKLIFFGIISQYIHAHLEEDLPQFIFPHATLDESEFYSTFRDICARREDCLNKRCTFFKECPYFNAIKKIKKSNIGVVNHWNMLGYIASGEFENIDCVIDEADKLDDAAVSAYTQEISTYYIFRVLKGISTGKRTFMRTFEELFNLEDSISMSDKNAFIKEIQRFLKRIRILLSTVIKTENSRFINVNLYDETENHDLEGVFNILQKLMVQVKLLLEYLSLIRDHHEKEITAAKYLNVRTSNLIEDLSFIYDTLNKALSGESIIEETEWVSLFSTDKNGGWTLSVRPVLADLLLKKYFYPKVKSLLMTSATISVDRSLAYFTRLCGVEDFRWRQLSSPFDLGEQMKIFVIDDIPAYSFSTRDHFRDSAYHSIKKMVDHTGGRLMMLFTSYADMHNIYERLSANNDSGHEILLQKQGLWYREYINEKFRSSTNAVLMGVKAYWYGIDFPGDILKYLVIFKMPYLPPNDIIVKKRKKMINNYMDFEAKLSFKQAIGRLIRTETDMGGVFILDKRIYRQGQYETFFTQLDPSISIQLIDTQSALEKLDEFLS